ncbi:MAG: hypothetical protein LAO19_21500 [Acidobacteriia bacterium]|nr:hypothetical protein [Terriglobia bacterium]
MTLNIHSVDEISKLYESLQGKRDRLREQLDAVEKQFDAVSTTLRLMGHLTPAQNINLSGLTQLDALIAIAKANDNKLVVKTARRLMVKAGYFKSTKHASSILFTTINRSGKFDRESPGVYRLRAIPPVHQTINLGDATMYTDDAVIIAEAKATPTHR